MAKRYGLTGIGSNVELGQGGERIKVNSNQIEFKNAADSALIKIKAADGSAADDVVTKSQLDAADGVKYRTGSITNSSSGAVNVGATITGTVAFRWQVNVTTVFNGTSPTLELGITGDTDAICATSEIDLTKIDQSAGTCHLDISSATQIIGTVVNGSSTAGAATIIIEAI